MGTAQNNVTEISRFTRERRNDNGYGRTPLDECREMAVLGLRQALGESLEQVMQLMLQQAERSTAFETFHLYMDVLELVRDRRDSIQGAFRTHFLRGFNLACRRDAGHSQSSVKKTEFSLVDPDDLEESLAAGTLVNAIHNGCVEELFGLDKRIGMLINDPDMVHGDNPLGPEVIAEALKATLYDEHTALKVRLLLTAQLSKDLPNRIASVYREINQRLVEKNVLPTIRVGLKRSSASAAPATTGANPENTSSQNTSADVFDMLRKLMGGGGVMPQGGPAMPGGVPVQGGLVGGGSVMPLTGPAMPGASPMQGNLDGGGLLGELGQLQRGQGDVAARAGLDLASLNNGRVNVLYELRAGGIAGQMTSIDMMTLDIVAMVFDYILDDTRIPDAMKALIGRLQIPILKVGMLDKAFFSNKGQPARRFLDALAEAAIGWDPEEGHEGGLYRTVEELVERILERFDDKISIFEETLADLQAFISGEQREAAVAAAASVQAIRLREVAEQSQLAAHDEVQSCLIGQPIPLVIVNFLTEQWQRMLADVHQKAGISSPAWKGAVQAMTDLIWSVKPKSGVEERKKLIDLLPSLLKRLDEGITYLDLGQAERDQFFTELVKCHAKIVRMDEQEDSEQQDVFAIPGVEYDIPTLSSLAEFEAVEPAVDNTAETGEIIEELIEEPVSSADDSASHSNDGLLDGLTKGTWIMYQQEDGSELRARLSWISPMRGIYLFTNRHGQRAISISAEGLLAKLQEGSVRILNDMPLIDRAVDNLMERLQRNAA